MGSGLRQTRGELTAFTRGRAPGDHDLLRGAPTVAPIPFLARPLVAPMARPFHRCVHRDRVSASARPSLALSSKRGDRPIAGSRPGRRFASE